MLNICGLTVINKLPNSMVCHVRKIQSLLSWFVVQLLPYKYSKMQVKDSLWYWIRDVGKLTPYSSPQYVLLMEIKCMKVGQKWCKCTWHNWHNSVCYVSGIWEHISQVTVMFVNGQHGQSYCWHILNLSQTLSRTTCHDMSEIYPSPTKSTLIVQKVQRLAGKK